MAGALAGAGFQLATGYVVRWTNSYVPLFIVAGLAYVVALLVIHTLSPKLAPAKLD
jgi:ACS family hexuronate transporter-like MFS transporter